ncbi:MAG: trigger factor [Clostridiales bacterium]|nr:trigger factor [Clostridiales bacterium]
MSTFEQLEKNKIKLTIDVSPEKFREGLQFSYQKNKGLVTIPGFRKGKAPRRVIERMYGKDFFYDDAINHVLPDAYENALDEHGVEPVYRPSIKLQSADEDNGVVFEAEVYVKPQVEVDGYYGLTYPKQDTEPNDSDIQAKLQAEREKNARQVSVDEPAQMGDIVSINFKGYSDGEPFEGGEGKDYDLTLGTHTFIDTFEDQIVGHVPGDDIEVNVKFPEDYGHTDLAGKDAMFEVEVLDVKRKEYPEIDDDFAQDVSEFDTLAEYRDSLAEKIRKEKEDQADMNIKTAVIKQLIEKTVMDVPEVMYTGRVEDMVEDLKHQLAHQGMSWEMYMQFAQVDEAALKESYMTKAHEEVDSILALEAVAKKEKIEASEEDYLKRVNEMAERFKMPADELLEKIKPDRKAEIIGEILNQKALDFLVEKAVAVEQGL